MAHSRLSLPRNRWRWPAPVSRRFPGCPNQFLRVGCGPPRAVNGRPHPGSETSPRSTWDRPRARVGARREVGGRGGRDAAEAPPQMGDPVRWQGIQGRPLVRMGLDRDRLAAAPPADPPPHPHRRADPCYPLHSTRGPIFLHHAGTAVVRLGMGGRCRCRRDPSRWWWSAAGSC